MHMASWRAFVCAFTWVRTLSPGCVSQLPPIWSFMSAVTFTISTYPTACNRRAVWLHRAELHPYLSLALP
jgi:hypothetical protein